MIRPKIDKPRGILNVASTRPMTGYWRYWPSDDLAPFVEHYWTIEWDEPRPITRETLPHPSVHLIVERGASRLGGTSTKRFTRVIEGKGRVVSVKFRAGGFRAFMSEPVSSLTDRVFTLDEIFGDEGGALEDEVLALGDREDSVRALEMFLRGRDPVADESGELASTIADRIASDREITRVDDLVRAFGLSIRRLQRLFDEYIGVSPKWVIQRYRLHEAAERIASRTHGDWASLALELGYADQAHFIRDFKKLVGRSPAEYAKSLDPGGGRR